MTTKIFWIVAPMSCPEASGRSGSRIGQTSNQAFAEAVAQRPRRDGRDRAAIGAEDEVAPLQNDGYGYVPDPKWTKSISHVFTTQEAANRHAEDLASKSPKTLFGVFGVGNVYETTTPVVITKSYNADGELVTK